MGGKEKSEGVGVGVGVESHLENKVIERVPENETGWWKEAQAW